MFSIRFIFKTSTVTPPPPQCFCFSNMSWSLSNYSKSLEKSERGEILGSNVLKVISFGKQGTKETLKTRIWNPATFGLWNPESTDTESGIHSVESRIQGSLGLPYMGRRVRHNKILSVLWLKILKV